MAWESNFRSAAHAPVRELSQQEQDSLRERYESALQDALAADATALTTGDVLFAFARKSPGDPSR